MSGKVIKEGYLTKSPPLEKLFAGWKKRYFRLFESGRLDYYVSESDNIRSAKGIINLLDCSDIDAVDNFGGRRNCIRMTIPGRTFVLQCASQSDVRQWREKILTTRDSALGGPGVPLESVQSLHIEDDRIDNPSSNGRPSPVATRGLPSSPGDDQQPPPYVNLREQDQLALPPRPNNTMRTYSPQPTSRNRPYVPGEGAGNSRPGKKVMRQQTFAGQTARYSTDISDLDKNKYGQSYNDTSIGHGSSPVVPPRTKENGTLPAQTSDESDKYGYVPMVRPEGVDVEDYERMQESMIPPPKRSPNPSKHSTLPPTPPEMNSRGGGQFQTPEEYEDWDSHDVIPSSNPRPGFQKPPMPPQRAQTQTRLNIKARPQPPTVPRPVTREKSQQW